MVGNQLPLAGTSTLPSPPPAPSGADAVMRLKNGLSKVILVQPKCVLIKGEERAVRLRADGISIQWAASATERKPNCSSTSRQTHAVAV